MDKSTSENQNLSRGLKNRHVQLLAIGGQLVQDYSLVQEDQFT
ncbi:amino acid permease [Clostridium beijerinckii]|nr:amino acid permease [Clostridium beijerinckii]NRW44998.1 amino acid permease [Clostridium beijerinckii]NSB35029.1 amino acid permease [Clostridium beijerinckii]